MKSLHTFLYLFLIQLVNIQAQDLDYAKSVVKKLASPELQGRGYTNNGNMLAAEFIAGEYKRIGLQPVKKTYFQKFDISINTFPNEISVKFNNETLKPGVDYLIESSSPACKGKFTIIKIKSQDLDTQEKLLGIIPKIGDNFILIDVTEKSTDKEINKKIDEYISFLKYSTQISCKGIVVYTKDRLIWDNSTTKNIRPIIIINKELDLNSFTSLELVIESTFIKKFSTQNIVGYFEGTFQPDSFLVITAHYDHLGRMGKGAYFPGANDNASGVAMLLSLAEYYAKNKPKYSIAFICFSAEEVGLLGSKEFTENPLLDLKRIKFLINYDLAGTGEEGIRVVNGSLYRDKFNLLTKINTEYNLLPKVDIRGAACNSDHCMFHGKGVPCFYIYTQGGIKAYHDVYDKSETLPLTEFVDYCTLMIKFFDAL